MAVHLTDPIGKANRSIAFIGGGVAVAGALVVCWLSENPRLVWHRLAAGCVLPPFWVMSLAWLLGFFLLGMAAGLLFSSCPHSAAHEAILWKGATYLLLAAVLALSWYILLFGKFLLLLSWLALLPTMAAALYAAILWWRLSPLCGGILGGYALWMLVLLILELAVMLQS